MYVMWPYELYSVAWAGVLGGGYIQCICNNMYTWSCVIGQHAETTLTIDTSAEHSSLRGGELP